MIDTIDEDNAACMTGRLVDFLTALRAGKSIDESGKPSVTFLAPWLQNLDQQDFEDSAAEIATEYVSEATEHEDPKPEWVGARNYGRHEEVFSGNR